MIIMRLRLLKSSLVLGSLMCVASLGAGCGPLSNVSSPGQSDSTALNPPTASPGSQKLPTPPTASPGSQKLPTPANGGAKQLTRSAQSQNARSDEWLLQPGLLGVKHGVWLGWTSLTFGISGIGLALFIRRGSARAMRRLNRTVSQLTSEMERADSSIKSMSIKSKNDREVVTSLQADFHKLEEKYSKALASISSLQAQQRIASQNHAISMPSQIVAQLSAQPYQPSPAERQAELTAAVNRGDRQRVRSETRAHLNITNASENAISMGRLIETELEEVSAGGSYWYATFGDDCWLYPTDQTLRGYTQSQRPTGVFNYIRQTIPSAQVLSPARLTRNGTLWQVAEMGSIAVPS